MDLVLAEADSMFLKAFEERSVQCVLTDMVEPNEAQLLTVINYQDFQQGSIVPVDYPNTFQIICAIS